MRTPARAFLLTVVGAVALDAEAAEPFDAAGKVFEVRGDVVVLRDGEAILASRGTYLEGGDAVMVRSSDGMARLLMAGESELRQVDPRDGRFAIEEREPASLSDKFRNLFMALRWPSSSSVERVIEQTSVRGDGDDDLWTASVPVTASPLGFAEAQYVPAGAPAVISWCGDASSVTFAGAELEAGELHAGMAALSEDGTFAVEGDEGGLTYNLQAVEWSDIPLPPGLETPKGVAGLAAEEKAILAVRLLQRGGSEHRALALGMLDRLRTESLIAQEQFYGALDCDSDAAAD